jgi:hypothetical protein
MAADLSCEPRDRKHNWLELACEEWVKVKAERIASFALATRGPPRMVLGGELLICGTRARERSSHVITCLFESSGIAGHGGRPHSQPAVSHARHT